MPANIEEINYTVLCSALCDHLIDAMRTAAITISHDPSGALFSDSEKEEIETQKTSFHEALNKENNSFYRRITGYMQYQAANLSCNQMENVFSADFPTPEDETNAELAELPDFFKGPKVLMGPAYEDLEHFSITVKNTAYSFDEPLKLIFKIKLLEGACYNQNIQKEWINAQYTALKVIIDKTIADLTTNPTEILPTKKNYPPTKLSELLIFKWDTFWWLASPTVKAHNALENPALNPLVMNNPQYLWYHPGKIFHFLLGRDVKQYLVSAATRFLVANIIFKNVFMSYYRTGVNWSYFRKRTILLKYLTNLILHDVIFALLKAIESLPIRLLRGLVNILTSDDSGARKNTHIILTVIDSSLTLALLLGFSLPIGVILEFIIQPCLQILSYIVEFFIFVVARNIIKCFSHQTQNNASTESSAQENPPIASQNNSSVILREENSSQNISSATLTTVLMICLDVKNLLEFVLLIVLGKLVKNLVCLNSPPAALISTSSATIPNLTLFSTNESPEIDMSGNQAGPSHRNANYYHQ